MNARTCTPVYVTSWDDHLFALKCVNAKEAKQHVQNTVLSHRFHIPIAPCVAHPLTYDREPNPLPKKKLSHTGPDSTHVLLMPYIEGAHFSDILTYYNITETHTELLCAAYRNILSHYVPLCLTASWDARAQNVIFNSLPMIAVKEDEEQKADIFNPALYTFIDAGFGLFTGGDPENSDPVDNTSFFMKLAYWDNLEALAPGSYTSLRPVMIRDCLFWKMKIADGAVTHGFENEKRLKKVLTERCDTLHSLLQDTLTL